MISCISLFDESGNMLRPWAEKGYECHCVDLSAEPRTEKVGDGCITFHRRDITHTWTEDLVRNIKPYFLFGFPPCTDVSVSGAKHFEKKMREDPFVQVKAAELALRVADLGTKYANIWGWENPKSMLMHFAGKPNYKFDPFEFGGYLPENDVHPRFPDIIPPRDAYRKETWLWTSSNFNFPEKAPVFCPKEWSPQTTKLGGKSDRTKQIRSETPRGFAKAVFMANRHKDL